MIFSRALIYILTYFYIVRKIVTFCYTLLHFVTNLSLRIQNEKANDLSFDLFDEKMNE